jgi:hypothetical protein
MARVDGAFYDARGAAAELQCAAPYGRMAEQSFDGWPGTTMACERGSEGG